MDAERFDRMTKALSHGVFRRRVLAGLVGGLAAVVLGRRGASARAFCGHSQCFSACTAAGFTGQQCIPICGSGQFRGFCPIGQGNNNPCCNPGLCNPANFATGQNGNPVYTGPTAGC